MEWERARLDPAQADPAKEGWSDVRYTDQIGSKGGGQYAYKVCEAGTSTCSGTVTVTF